MNSVSGGEKRTGFALKKIIFCVVVWALKFKYLSNLLLMFLFLLLSSSIRSDCYALAVVALIKGTTCGY